MTKYLVRVQVDTWLQRFLDKLGLVIGIEYGKTEFHLVAIFLARKKDLDFKL